MGVRDWHSWSGLSAAVHRFASDGRSISRALSIDASGKRAGHVVDLTLIDTLD